MQTHHIRWAILWLFHDAGVQLRHDGVVLIVDVLVGQANFVDRWCGVRQPRLRPLGHGLALEIISTVYYITTIVCTVRARLSGFRVGFSGQNPSLAVFRLSGFQAFGLFRAFSVL